MGAVALIALIAGGPLGMCLALAYGAVSVMKIAKVDSQYAKSGGTPPSARLIEKWLDSRAAKGATPQKAKPYGSWAYAKQRWHAMWEDLGEEHAAQRDADRKARAEARAQGLPVPPRRTLKDKITALKAWKWQITTPARERQSTATIDDLMGGPAGTPPGKVDGPRTACEDCGQTLTITAGTWNHPSSAGCPRRAAPAEPVPDLNDQPRITPETGSPAPTPHTATEPNRTDEGDPVALREIQNGDRRALAPDTLTELRDTGGMVYNVPTSTPTGGSTMTSTQQSGEVTGLQSAINYAAAVAAAHAAHSLGGGETYMASLAQAEVGPETIQSAGRAQEASAIAAAAWTTHGEKLKEQLAAKEATTAETGKKEFLLAE